jgi:hypothetical protein
VESGELGVGSGECVDRKEKSLLSLLCKRVKQAFVSELGLVIVVMYSKPIFIVIFWPATLGCLFLLLPVCCSYCYVIDIANTVPRFRILKNLLNQ